MPRVPHELVDRLLPLVLPHGIVSSQHALRRLQLLLDYLPLHLELFAILRRPLRLGTLPQFGGNGVGSMRLLVNGQFASVALTDLLS